MSYLGQCGGCLARPHGATYGQVGPWLAGYGAVCYLNPVKAGRGPIAFGFQEKLMLAQVVNSSTLGHIYDFQLLVPNSDDTADHLVERAKTEYIIPNACYPNVLTQFSGSLLSTWIHHICMSRA